MRHSTFSWLPLLVFMVAIASLVALVLYDVGRHVAHTIG